MVSKDKQPTMIKQVDLSRTVLGVSKKDYTKTGEILAVIKLYELALIKFSVKKF